MNKDLTPLKRLYSIKDTSIYLGRSVNGIRQMLWDGKIPFIKDGKRVFVDVRDVDAWIEKNKTNFSY